MDNMTLSAKERHQLLSVLREMDSAAPREKRQTPRRSVVLRVRIRVISALGKTTAHWALLRDVSARGIGLTLPFALSKGARLVAPLKFREGGGWLVLCEVRNLPSAPASSTKSTTPMAPPSPPWTGSSKPTPAR